MRFDPSSASQPYCYNTWIFIWSPTMSHTSSLGTIVFYLPERGYGYLRLQGSLEEFHFRKQNLRVATVTRGDLVRFVLREGRQGWYADAIEAAGIA